MTLLVKDFYCNWVFLYCGIYSSKGCKYFFHHCVSSRFIRTINYLFTGTAICQLYCKPVSYLAFPGCCYLCQTLRYGNADWHLKWIISIRIFRYRGDINDSLLLQWLMKALSLRQTGWCCVNVSSVTVLSGYIAVLRYSRNPYGCAKVPPASSLQTPCRGRD